MSFKPRFVAVDLDGTVLLDGRIGERTLAVFASLRARGLVILVATGRPRRSTLPWAAKLGAVSGLVCHNGAAVYDAAGALLSEVTIEDGTARRLVALARGIPQHFHGFIGDEWYYETPREGTARYEGRSGFPGRRVDFSSMERLGFHKTMFVATEPEVPALVEAVSDSLGPALEIYPTGSGFVELVAPGISKGRSLARLVESLGGRMEEVLAFGDAWNDLDMLRMAGAGVAMGNAPEPMRAQLSLVAPPASEEGVALWLEENLAWA